MLNLALLCPELAGHINPMLALGSELKRRGHRVTMLAMPDGEDACRAAGIELIEFASEEIPRGYWDATSETLGRLSGRRAVKFTVEQYCKSASVLMKHTPKLLQKLQPDGLILDQTYTAVAAVADYLNLPYVSVCGALPMNTEPGVPPIVLDWPYRTSRLSRLRNRLGHLMFQRATTPVRRLINAQRVGWNLKINDTIDETFSDLAQIGQIPREFDFPRRDLPPTFHYVGPLHNTETRAAIPFPYDRLDGRPLIYASMGTLQNRLDHVFATIAEACAGLDAQLVLSLGRKGADINRNLAGSPLIVDYAPQLDLIQRSSLVITHAGMNTAMETLSQGVPVVAIPVTNDQPGVAARIQWTGVGEKITLARLRPARLRETIRRVLENPSYRDAARKMQQSIQSAGGPVRAAEICEQAISTKKPVRTADS